MTVNLNSIFLMVHLCVLCLGYERDGWPGYTFYPALQGYLKLHTIPTNWLDAKLNCGNEGAFLAEAWRSGDFTSAVTKLQQPLPVVFSGTQVVYFDGLYKECGSFLANGTTGQVDCKLNLPYVCFAFATASARGSTTTQILTTTTASPPTSTTTTTSPSTTTTSPPTSTTTLPSTPTNKLPVVICEGFGYEFSNLTGRCYKFHTEVLHWDMARTTCLTEFGDLAVINNEIEGAVFLYMIKSAKRSYVALGVYKEDGKWKAVDGSNLEQSGYKWKTGVSAKYVYGCLLHDGETIYAFKTSDLSFICEKSPTII